MPECKRSSHPVPNVVLAHPGSAPNSLRIAYILNLNGNKNKSQPKQPHGTGSLQKKWRSVSFSQFLLREKKGNCKLLRLDSLPCCWGLSGEGSPCNGADRTRAVCLPGWIRTALSLASCCLLINALMNYLLIPIIILIFGGWTGF